jgi:orotidine-5'-phosphate decarboxylase
MVNRPSFCDQLERSWQERSSLVCVGLDPLPDRLPDPVARDRRGVLDFCTAIVDAVADVVCAFKPQVAHFAAIGAESGLADLIDHIHRRHPGVPVILDAKRGDIGSTARRYAVEAFERYDADAVTANPYLGPESLRPFLDWPGRGVVVLCRTSNPDSAWLQDYPAGDPVYLRVARAAAEWNSDGNVMLVTGATYPDELARIRAAVGDMGLLVPGIGAQGGDLEATLGAGLRADGRGLVVATSRAVLYASPGADFAAAARAAAVELRDAINAARRPS